MTPEPRVAAFLFACATALGICADARAAFQETAGFTPPGIYLQRASEGLALSGEFAFVGAPRALQTPKPGLVHVYRRGGNGQWSLIRSLTAPGANPNVGDFFGRTVAAAGDTLVVGARRAIHVFGRNVGGSDAWGHVATLVPATMDANDGELAVALDGNVIVAGSRAHGPGLNFQGRAYVFERGANGQWAQSDTLDSFDAHAGAYFGEAVAVSGNTILVGQPNQFPMPGRVYIFRRGAGDAGSWGATNYVEADPATYGHGCGGGDHAGRSVSVSGPIALIGAPDCGDGGIAFTVVRTPGTLDDWQFGDYFHASGADQGQYDSFGAKVVIHGNLAAIGTNTFRAAYVFQHRAGTWNGVGRFTGSDNPGTGTAFARHLAVDANHGRIVIGAPGTFVDNQGESGKAYLFSDPAVVFASGFE